MVDANCLDSWRGNKKERYWDWEGLKRLGTSGQQERLFVRECFHIVYVT